MHLGIDSTTGLLYEGYGDPIHPIFPSPNVTRAYLIESGDDWKNLPLAFSNDTSSWIFREDSFDHVTRTRRGRLYSPFQSSQPSRAVVAPHPADYPPIASINPSGALVKYLYTYISCTQLMSKPNQGLGMKLALGAAEAVSVWRIVQTELLANRCILVTLKSLNAFGILPELDLDKVEYSHQAAVTQAMNRALDSAFRETSTSVIDQCKNAIAVILARWLAQQGHDPAILSKDIGEVAKAISANPYNMYALEKIAQVVGRLHARGKGNEQHAKEARNPTEEDAQLALESLGFVLRDIGWSK